jgi:hypothetical protein
LGADHLCQRKGRGLLLLLLLQWPHLPWLLHAGRAAAIEGASAAAAVCGLQPVVCRAGTGNRVPRGTPQAATAPAACRVAAGHAAPRPRLEETRPLWFLLLQAPRGSACSLGLACCSCILLVLLGGLHAARGCLPADTRHVVRLELRVASWHHCRYPKKGAAV